MMPKIKVFIVENSILMQQVIADILSSDPEIEVVGCAKSGREALEKIPQVHPDVVTLDLNLPDTDGLSVLKDLMQHFPARVVVISAYTQNGAELTLKALELGALDFIPKPSGEISLDLYSFKNDIISKIKLVMAIDLGKVISISKVTVPAKDISSVNKIVVIGASTGGPKVIQEIIQQIPFDVRASFLIIQHMPKGFTKTFSQRVFSCANIKIKECENQDPILNGAGYIGRSGFHMTIEMISSKKNRYRLKVDMEPTTDHLKPSLDVTMGSVAQIFAGKIIGVVLTGMGKDGLIGAKKIKEKGGKIIVQDEASCVVYGMPRAIVEAGLADAALPLSEIPKKIIEYLTDG